MSRRDAEAFARLASLAREIDGKTAAQAPADKTNKDDAFARFGVTRRDIRELEAAGLVIGEGGMRVVYLGADDAELMTYKNRTFRLTSAPKGAAAVERVVLSASGAELARTVAPKPDDAYLETMLAHFRAGYEVAEVPEVGTRERVR